MEVKSGYQRTEVGVIPDEWQAGSLALFWGVTDCKHVTARFINNGIPVASIGEVQSRLVDLRNAKQTTEGYYSLLIEGGRKPQPGDLIMSRNATVGELAQVKEWHPPFAMGQDVCLLRKKNSTYSTDYLQEIFKSSIISRQLDNSMVGSTFKRVNVEQIRDFLVPMPPPIEQAAISQVLSDVDALLSSLDQLIAKKREIKQAAMQRLLTGKQRLPGFSGEWMVKPLGELADVVMGQSPSSSHYNLKREGLPLVQGNADIKDRLAIERVYTREITKRGLPGDILLSVRAPVGEVARTTFEVCLGRGVCALRSTNEFLYHALVYQEPMWARFSSGSTFDSVNSIQVKSFKLGVPTDTGEQIAIASILSDMDAEIAALEQKREKARALKQGMMQELLTGRIRLV